jgi:chromosome segregation ATPase
MEDKAWPVDSTSTTTKLLEKRRMMYEVKEEFNQAKDEERELENDFKATETRLRSRDLELQQELIKYNQILQENELKRGKAKKKYDEEVKLKKQKEEKIDVIKSEIKALKEKNAALEKEVVRMRKYEDFLERVKERNPDDFPDISDILGRYTTLKDSSEKLNKKKHQLEEEQTVVKRERDLYEKTNKEEMMELNIEISVLQKQIEEIEVERSELQKNFEFASSTATEKDLELGCMLTAIENLFDRCLQEIPRIRHGYNIDNRRADNYDNYNDRAKIAVQKLGSIINYVKDVESITKSEECQEILISLKESKGQTTKHDL